MGKGCVPAARSMETVIAAYMQALKSGADSKVALLIARRVGKSRLSSILSKLVNERGEDNGRS